METQEIKIRFSHCDSAGFMLFSKAFELFHDHFEDFVTDHWKLPWDLYFANPKYAFPLVHIECDYAKPLKASDSVQMRFSAQIQGESSFKLTVEAFKENEKCFVVQSVHVAMDKIKMQKAPLPEFLKIKL
jgi:acyl-CoA thioesterase FadM